MKNPLFDASHEFLLLVFKFQDKKNWEDLSCDSFQEMIKKSLMHLDERLNKEHSNDIQETKYALTAMLDEFVLSSNWKEKQIWMSKTLQWIYFGQHNAGEEFFKKINETKLKGEEKINLLEIYYLCLQLGFQGIYKVRGIEALELLKTDLANFIKRFKKTGPILIPSPNKENISFQKINRPFYLRLILISFFIMFLIYIGFLISIHHTAYETILAIGTS